MRSILVSSGLPSEGKSFVALNLALSFALHKGNRVLLIDGDMRRSSLHKLLGTPREPGLTEYLSGQAELMQVLQRPQVPTGSQMPAGLTSLCFIAGGRDADKAGDLAANARFPELIARVSATFDWIVVDSSPANLVSDAISLSHACDGVLLVAREGVTKYKTAQQAQAQFKSTAVLGFVLNAVHKLPAKSDYYSSYENDRAES
jgi:protein-tyrosine kinase